MSIFSSIGNAIKSVATSIGSSIKSAFGGGSSQTASLNGAYIPGSYTGTGQNTTKDLVASRNTSGVGNGASGSWSPTVGMTPTPTGGSYSPTIGMTPTPTGGGYAQQPVTIGGSSSSSVTAPLNNFVQMSQAPTTITAKGLNSSLASSSSLASGGTQSLVLPNNSTGSNPGSVNNTNLAGVVTDKILNQKTNQFEDAPIDPNVKNDQQLAQDRASLYERLLGKKESALNSPEIQAQNQLINQRRQEVNNITAELNAVVAKQNQDLLQLRETGSKEGVTEAVYGGQQATINREAAYRALPLQAQVSAAQGNLQLAQDYLGQLKEMKTEEINNEFNYRKGMLEAVLPVLDKADQRRYEELKSKTENTYKESQKFVDTQNELLQSAVSQRAPSAIINAISNAKTTQQAIVAAGQYGGNILDREIQQAQLSNIKSQIQDRETVSGTKMTAVQATAAGFADRMIEASKIIDEIGDNFTGVSSYLGALSPNPIKSSDRQKFEQAQRNFINAVLRKESGAVISEEEFANAKQQYFPQPGDGAEVLAQKKQNRFTSTNGLLTSAGLPTIKTAQSQSTNDPLGIL
tara:strand:+ start:2885 stop:4612 length:1728 start_codon:yes stop_codon:yes gene_type:complete